MQFKRVKLIILVLLLGFGALAQSDTTQAPPRLFMFDGGYIYGKVLKIHPFFPDRVASQGFELQFLEQTAGRKYWHQECNYPVRGVSLVYLNLGNDSILGSAIGANYFHRHTQKISKRLNWDWRIGIGLGFFNKYHDNLDNPDNYVIGSRITAFGALSTGFRYQVAQHFSVYAQGAFLHYSNGHVRVPNIGANIITASLGVEYNLHPGIAERKKYDLPPIKKNWLLNFDFGLGFHEIEGTVLPSGGPMYHVYFGSIYASKRLNYRNQLQLGFNLNYFTDYYDYIINQQVFLENERQKSYKGIVFAGYEWLYGQLAFNLQLGVNVYYPFRKELIKRGELDNRWMDVYNTNLVAFKYYLRPTKQSTRYNPFLGLGLRTIGGKADFVELRVGVGI